MLVEELEGSAIEAEVAAVVAAMVAAVVAVPEGTLAAQGGVATRVATLAAHNGGVRRVTTLAACEATEEVATARPTTLGVLARLRAMQLIPISTSKLKNHSIWLLAGVLQLEGGSTWSSAGDCRSRA